MVSCATFNQLKGTSVPVSCSTICTPCKKLQNLCTSLQKYRARHHANMFPRAKMAPQLPSPGVLQDVLEKLRMLLEDGKACREGDWIVGCSAVSVCRHILQAHSTRSVTGGQCFVHVNIFLSHWCCNLPSSLHLCCAQSFRSKSVSCFQN